MAYVVLTENEATAGEQTREALDRIKAALDANAAILKAGNRAVVPDTIRVGAQGSIGQFPAIQIEPVEVREVPATLGGDGVNTLEMTFRLYAYEVALGQVRELTRNLTQLSDRIQTVLRRNPTLDGFCRDVRIGRIVLGRLRGGPRTSNPVFAPHPVLVTMIEATVVTEIART